MGLSAQVESQFFASTILTPEAAGIVGSHLQLLASDSFSSSAPSRTWHDTEFGKAYLGRL